MQISPLCKALALHEIFDERGIAAGGYVPLSEIERAWRATGLRKVDLSETLTEARVTGEFAVEDGVDGHVVVLTELGFEHAQRDLSTLREIDDLIRAYATLSLLRRRKPVGYAHGRRRSDKVDGEIESDATPRTPRGSPRPACG